MNIELLLLMKKHTDTLVEQTKTKPQETLQFKLNKQMQTFSFNPQINLLEEGEWFLGVSSFECTNSVFKITNENNSFSIFIPGHYQTEFAEKMINDLKKLIELKSLELYVIELRKSGNELILADNENELSDFDTQKNEMLVELKNVKYNDLEDLVYRMQLTYDETIDILDLKYFLTKRMGYSLNLGIYEVVDLNNILKHILPDNVKVSVTIDDVRLKSNLKINQILILTEKSFFYTILGFTRSRSYPLDDIDGFYQLIAEFYKSDKPIINITEDNNKFELYRDNSNKFGFLELKDELEEIVHISQISQEYLQDHVIGPRIIDEPLKLSHEKKNGNGYMIILLGYSRSLYRDFESYLRIVVGLDEEDIQLILKQYNSHFITNELTPGIYTIQDISDAVHTFSGHTEIIEVEYDDISMKTKIILK